LVFRRDLRKEKGEERRGEIWREERS